MDEAVTSGQRLDCGAALIARLACQKRLIDRGARERLTVTAYLLGRDGKVIATSSGASGGQASRNGARIAMSACVGAFPTADRAFGQAAALGARFGDPGLLALPALAAAKG
jgi:hypothetical protein